MVVQPYIGCVGGSPICWTNLFMFVTNIDLHCMHVCRIHAVHLGTSVAKADFDQVLCAPARM